MNKFSTLKRQLFLLGTTMLLFTAILGVTAQNNNSLLILKENNSSTVQTFFQKQEKVSDYQDCENNNPSNIPPRANGLSGKNNLLTYCSASGGGDEYISGVLFGSIDNQGTSADNYSAYTSQSTIVTVNQSYSITISYGFAYGNDDIGIWIDFNQDGDFDDAGENVVCNVGLTSLTETYSITIPEDALIGNTTIRIRMKCNGTDCGTPCGTTSYGEVEDYKVTIQPATNTWIGNTTEWNIDYNWSDNNVPTQSYNVTIPSSPSGGNIPVISFGTNAKCNALTLESGACVTAKGNLEIVDQLSLSSSSNIIINNGAAIVVNDIENTSGNIENNGTLTITEDVANNSGGLFDNTSTGTVNFSGGSAQTITGTSTLHFYGTLDINNTNGISISGSDQQIHGSLIFTEGNISLNNYNLEIGTTDPTGASASSYIATNGTGELKRTIGANDVIFPVGNSSYNPIMLNNSGSSDTYGVRVVDHEPENASNPHMVDRSWVVSESTPGNSNLAVTPQWNQDEELTGFDRTNSVVGLTTDSGTNYSWGSSGNATGTDPYTHIGSGFTIVGEFTMGDDFYSGIVVDLKVFLMSAYSTSTHKMTTSLNTAGLLPTTDPYGLGITVTSVPTAAVDWVKIELRDKNDHTSILYSFARFIDENGQVIEEDGSNLKLKEVPKDSYYIAIIHRNHLGVISNSTVNLDSSPILDFTGDLSKAWDDPGITTNNAMKEAETGVYALWCGDANSDGTVSYNGTGNDRTTILTQVGENTPGNTVQDTYSANDVNMDGKVKYNGAGSDRSTILSVIGVSTPNSVCEEHLPE